MKLVKNENNDLSNKISDKEADAFIKILKWIGKIHPERGQLKLQRGMKAFKEYFKGYTKMAKK